MASRTKKTKKEFKKESKLETMWGLRRCFYLCHKCGKWFLIENFDLKRKMCRNCTRKEMEKEMQAKDEIIK